MDSASRHAEARAFAGGRFIAVGTNDEIGNLPSAGVTRVNLEGRIVVPGFIDAHLHTASSGLRDLKLIPLSMLTCHSTVGEYRWQ